MKVGTYKKTLLSFMTIVALVTTFATIDVFAKEMELRYIVGKVQSISNNSNQQKLDITAYVPTPSSEIEHQISGLCFVQDCNPNGECVDVPYTVTSGWSWTGASVLRYDYAHYNHDRQPRVVGYR